MSIRIIIADDDQGMLTVMRHLVQKSEGFELVAEASNGPDLLKLSLANEPDVILMDVEMPGLTGIECAEIIQEHRPKTVFIFATAHEEYMKPAFELYAFDYLVKPFRIERALNTLRLVRERLSERAPEPKPAAVQPARPGKLMLKHRDGMTFVEVSEILLIQRTDKSTELVCTEGRRFVTGDGLTELEERLPAEIFFRCHKSYIINLNHISSITPYGRWTSIVRMDGTDADALITHERLDELRTRFA